MSKAVFTFLVAASALLAQAPAPGPLVRLYPVAVDAGGQPVTDLTADDFKITDLNKPESIFFFHPPAHETASKPDVLEFSNRASGVTPHTTAVLFDMINLTDADRLENWRTLDKMFPQLESGEHLYFYVLNLEGTLIPIHAMGPKAADDKTWPQNVAAEFDKVMKKYSHARAVQIGAEEQQKRTFKALEDIANNLAMFPGRRDILWVANGLTVVGDPKIPNSSGDWVEWALYVPHLAVTLAGDEVAVDPYVLVGDLSPDVNYNMTQVSRLTGGHYYSRQDLKTVVNQVAQDAAGSYTMFYDPGADNWNNKWHQLRVTCQRSGVKVQVRERYYAVADSRTPVERNKAALMQAFNAPIDMGGVGLRVKISTLGSQPGVHLQIIIDPSDLLLRQQAGKYSGALYCLISDRNATGAVGEPAVLDLHPDLTADQYKAALKEGLPLPQDHPTSASMVRVIVLDQNTNQVGSVTFPVK
ncbi:MAG TPA: VWA domain-containing protein [Bryobacteraceae bacterium]|nr:VWA domain-containing protein [Bryobacteraceae bacterium]